MGRPTGLEPATTRTTTESSTAELRPPQANTHGKNPSGEQVKLYGGKAII